MTSPRRVENDRAGLSEGSGIGMAVAANWGGMDDHPESAKRSGRGTIKHVSRGSATVVSRRWMTVLAVLIAGSAVRNVLFGDLEEALLAAALSGVLIVLILFGKH